MNVFMLRRISLFLDFYSMFAAATLGITFACMILLYQFGLKPFVYIFWFKMITLALCVYGAYRYRGNRFYYYKNLGLSVRALWVGTVLLDLLIFTGGIVFILKVL